MKRGYVTSSRARGCRWIRRPQLTPERFLELMAVDKKVLDGQLRLVLLQGIGRSLVTGEFDPGALEKALESYH